MTRNRLETIYDILTLANQGIKKTHLMYKANLSHPRLEKFLEVLINLGLVNSLVNKNGSSYMTTSRGHEFINDFKKIQTLMGEDD